MLCGDYTPKTNVFWRVAIRAKSLEEGGGLRAHPGEEFLMVLTGQLEFHMESYNPVILMPGDSVRFDSNIKHGYVCAGESATEILMFNNMSSEQVKGFLDLRSLRPEPDAGPEQEMEKIPRRNS